MDSYGYPVIVQRSNDLDFIFKIQWVHIATTQAEKN